MQVIENEGYEDNEGGCDGGEEWCKEVSSVVVVAWGGRVLEEHARWNITRWHDEI